MMPRLGEKYDVGIVTTSKPLDYFRTEQYRQSGLPVAPAVVVGDVLVAQGCKIPQYEVEKLICTQLGLPQPEPPQKGLLGRLFSK